MKNTNSTQHEKVKAILEKTNPNEFDINKFIEDVKLVKEENKKSVKVIRPNPPI